MSLILHAGPAHLSLGASAVFSIPHDPVTIFIYALVVLAGFTIWYGDRQTRKTSEKDGPDRES